jgi:acetyl-CoA synthetase
MGELALRPGWPSMMRGYLHEQARYDKCFNDGWYLSGDLAMRDADGYFWFVGRSNDLIKSAGHLIGPFEVESALMEHPAVAEVAVIGVPDETAGELVRRWPPKKSHFAKTCPRPEAARSCGACSRRANLGCQKGISQLWKVTRNDRHLLEAPP